ncbi:antitoxin [Neorhizobium sp. DT-125]|uniref:antitoxin n=1 Tax=Neorhizobium sp. DT-125 TaxID=3396163 RepID=UPI003F1CD3A0
MNEHSNAVRIAQVFKNGRSRAIRIPKEFEFEGDKVEISKNEKGDLLVHPVGSTKSLLEVLATLEPLGEEDRFPDLDDDNLLPLDEVDL